jgi:hypothetical protein
VHRWGRRPRWLRPSTGLIEARRLREEAEQAERVADEQVRTPLRELRKTNHVAADIALLIRARGVRS